MEHYGAPTTTNRCPRDGHINVNIGNLQEMLLPSEKNAPTDCSVGALVNPGNVLLSHG